VSKVQVLYRRFYTKYTTRPYIFLGTKLFWTAAGIACLTSDAMENLCWLSIVLGERSSREEGLFSRIIS
jgi:hypothetical protein